MLEITLTIIKPDAVENGYTTAILNQITKAGFRIIALKMYHLSAGDARDFYAVHKGRPFYDELVAYMSSGPVVAAILQKEKAISAFRELIGNTDPAIAAEGTIRNKFGTNVQSNAVHGSDSPENAQNEASFFFSQFERFYPNK
jgi:nucleoside-diphosphate kinase